MQKSEVILSADQFAQFATLLVEYQCLQKMLLTMTEGATQVRQAMA